MLPSGKKPKTKIYPMAGTDIGIKRWMAGTDIAIVPKRAKLGLGAFDCRSLQSEKSMILVLTSRFPEYLAAKV